MNGFRRLILTLTGLVVFLHGISLYALPSASEFQEADMEMSEETSEQTAQVYAYDAVVPVVQFTLPHIWYCLGEIVEVSVSEFPVYHSLEAVTGRFFDLLFPHIISPNAP